MRYISLGLLVLFVIFLEACFAKKIITGHTTIICNKKITGTINKIDIKDLRKNVTNRNYKLPLLTVPGMKDEIALQLNDYNINAIKDVTTQHFTLNSDTIYNIEIQLIQGEVGYKTHALYENGYANVEMVIKITNQYGNITNFHSNYYLACTFALKPDNLDFLFKRVLMATTNKCFKNNIPCN